MTAPHSPTRSEDTTRKIDLNVTHVAATALAAVTAAMLGSGLGAAGTVIGAAAASVITTVGTAVYKASLERSRKRVRSLARRPRPSPASRDESRVDPAPPTAVPGPLSDEHLTGSTGRRLQPRDHSERFARLRWGAVVVAALGGFLLAMMLITGFEWANGATVGGNGKGTTIGRVINDRPPPREPATPPASPDPAAPASETPTETTEPSATSTSTPDGGTDVKRRPTATSDTPEPSEMTPAPPLIPTGLPGVGD